MRILVTGRDGQLGWELVRALAPLGEVIAVGRGECDLAQPDQTRAAVRGARPELIVNAAAYTAVDRAESEPALAQAINADAPALLAEEAKRLGAALIHYSTDYVFDGRTASPYVETDAVNPLSAYGRTKLAGELAVAAAGVPHFIARTSWVFAARGRNFVRTVLRLARERDVLTIVDDQWGAPTWARTIAAATRTIIAQAAAHPGSIAAAFGERGGLHHLTATGATNWFEFARAVLAQVADPARRLQRLLPIASSEYPTPAARPANSRLDCARIAQRWNVVLPAWDQALAQCLRELDPSTLG
jgi:dTDP-4-dehydrorhamnose reductase